MPPELKESGWVFAACAVGLFFLREFWALLRGRGAELEKAVRENTHALLELRIEMRFMRESISRIGKLSDDVRAAHDKIRRLESEGAREDKDSQA